MSERPNLELALYGGHESGGYRFLARSPGFREEWLAEAERLCTGFGERPAGVNCPRAIFAHSFGTNQVAVVQVTDQGFDDHGRPGSLAFYLVVFPATLYAAVGGDPFYLADQLPPPWRQHEDLRPVPCPDPAPYRTCQDVQRVLQSEWSDRLLGGSQALVDGGRFVFVRSAPEEGYLRGLWSLLPLRTRAELWPASYAFGNALQFHAAILPRLSTESGPRYLNEEQIGDYPEGRYELSVQTAAEQGDQRALDELFSRRTPREVIRMGLILLVGIGILALVVNVIKTPVPEKAKVHLEQRESFDLPPSRQFEWFGNDEENRMQARLSQLVHEMHLPPPPTPGTLTLAFGAAAAGPFAAIMPLTWDQTEQHSHESLLGIIDRTLGTPNSKRDPGPLHLQGHPKRQLRILLWKHSVTGYDQRELSPGELIERLREKVEQDRQAKVQP